MKTLLISISAALFSFGFTTVSADTLKVYVGDQRAETSGSKPGVGMSKQQVLSQYGQPSGKKGAVGQPPISSWEYTGFIVYFEYSHVVHAVAKR